MATGLTKLIETVTGPLEEKRRWWRYKARVKQLPENYRTAVEALQRYSYYRGPGSMEMLEDLIDLFEQGAASGTPVREIVGEDPSDFAEEFFRNYGKQSWITRQRERLARDIARAAGEDAGDADTGGADTGDKGTSR
jgi:DNA-binding ferritin-like protein (Dps family)